MRASALRVAARAARGSSRPRAARARRATRRCRGGCRARAAIRRRSCTQRARPRPRERRIRRRERGRPREPGRPRSSGRASRCRRRRPRGRSRRPSSCGPSELEARHSDLERSKASHDAVAWCEHLADERRTGKRVELGIAALGPNPALVHLACGAVRRRLFGALSGVVQADAEVRKHEEARAGVEDEIAQVRWALGADRLHRLAHLERVADGVTERLVHVGEKTDDLPTSPPAEIDHLLGEDACVVERLHERPVADLHVQHDRVRSAASFLDMIEDAMSGTMSTVAVTSRSA